MGLLQEIEAQWFETAAEAILTQVSAHSQEQFYAAAFWLFYGDYRMFGTPLLALNTESWIAAMDPETGIDLRWHPPDWQYSHVDSAYQAMEPYYMKLSDHLAGRGEVYWEIVSAEHQAGVARVCRRLTHEIRSRSGVFAEIRVPDYFVVGIFETREDDPLFTELVRASIAPEILSTLPFSIWE